MAFSRMVILYIDADLVAVDKEAGISTLADEHHAEPALAELVRAEVGEAHLVHRLDRDTSGVVLFARTARAMTALAGAFEARAVSKEYLALVVGRPHWDAQTVRAPLRANADHAHRTAVDRERGKPAETRFDVIERWHTASLVRARPGTGRTHQIRVHLMLVGNPIVNDALYDRGYGPATPLQNLHRLALHARMLEFMHPMTGAPMRVESPLPHDLAGAIEELRARR